jgi:hypothetical protein
MAEGTREAWERRRREPAEQTSFTTGQTNAVNRTILGRWASATEEEASGRSTEEMADAEEGGVEDQGITMAKNKTLMTMATPVPTVTENATAAGTGIEHVNGLGAAVHNA